MFTFFEKGRDADYGPFFLERRGSKGDVGYPKGFNLSSAEEILVNAFNEVMRITGKLEGLLKTKSDYFKTGLAETFKVMQELNGLAAQFKETLKKKTSANISSFSPEVDTLANETIRLTNDLVTKLDSFAAKAHPVPLNALTLVGIRAFTDVLQITRRSIPDIFSQAKTKIGDIMGKMIKKYVTPNLSNQLGEDAKNLIEGMRKTDLTLAKGL
jgi:hypothetical protein